MIAGKTIKEVTDATKQPIINEINIFSAQKSFFISYDRVKEISIELIKVKI